MNTENSKIKSFRDLIIWQKSIQLVSEIYLISKEFPKDEQFGIISQIRRLSISVSSNIAEGFGRNSGGDFKRFLNIALGSLYEVETQIEISKNLGFISLINYEGIISKCQEIQKMTNSLIIKIKTK